MNQEVVNNERSFWDPAYAIAIAIVLAAVIWGFVQSEEFSRFVIWSAVFAIGSIITVGIVISLENADGWLFNLLGVILMIWGILAAFHMIGSMPDFVMSGKAIGW